MSGFIWSSGHLGWGFFLLLVYSAACVIAGDLAWRLVTINARKLVPILGVCWLVGVGLILLAFQ